jgi:hypothetical protein
MNNAHDLVLNEQKLIRVVMMDLNQLLKIDLQYAMRNPHYQQMKFLEYVYFWTRYHPERNKNIFL